MSPWENYHKSQLVKPILIKPVVLDQGHARYLSEKFQTQKKSINFIDIIETVTCISTEEIGKLGLLVPGASLHCFQKRSTLDTPFEEIYLFVQSNLKYTKF